MKFSVKKCKNLVSQESLPKGLAYIDRVDHTFIGFCSPEKPMKYISWDISFPHSQ